MLFIPANIDHFFLPVTVNFRKFAAMNTLFPIYEVVSKALNYVRFYSVFLSVFSVNLCVTIILKVTQRTTE